MSYLVLARKWRPQRFDEVVGQGHIVKTLSNAIKNDRVAHAFIFSGVRGVGKTSIARILSKSLNCALGPTLDPCGTCPSCQTVSASQAVDVIEIDGASNNSVEDIRELRETVPYRPQLGKFKIYVIDEVHMLSISAFNALLKTLEEPPPHVKFIFATTEPHKVPVTILSRCQRYDFRRIPTATIIERVATILTEEKIQSEEKALSLIGREAEGSMRDALSILDQVLAAGGDTITADGVADLLGIVDSQVLFDLGNAVLKGDARRSVEIVRQVEVNGYNITTFAKGLLEHLGNLVVAGVCKDDASVLDLPDQEKKELLEQASSVTIDTLHRLFKHFSEAYESIARSSHPRILLETSLARIADLGELVSANDLVERLEALAKKGGSMPPSGQSKKTVQKNQSPPRTPTPNRNHQAEKQPDSKAGQQSQDVERHVSKPPSLDHVKEKKVFSIDGDWQGIIRALNKQTPTLASMLEYGVPEVDKENGSLLIRFSKEYKAIAKMAVERKDEIAKSINDQIGSPLRVDVIVDDLVGVPTVTRKRMEEDDRIRKREEEARQHPLVLKAQAEFGSTVAQVRLNEKPKG